MKTLLKLTVFAWSIFAISQIEAFMYPMVSKDGELLALNIDPDVPGTFTISARSMYDAILKKFGIAHISDITLIGKEWDFEKNAQVEYPIEYNRRFVGQPFRLEIATGDTSHDNTWYFFNKITSEFSPTDIFYREEGAIKDLDSLIKDGKVSMDADKAPDVYRHWLRNELAE